MTTEIYKIAASRFVEFTDKEISEIKINSVPKTQKELCKNAKTIIRLRLGDYRGIFPDCKMWLRKLKCILTKVVKRINNS
jgi:hypothetical protein